MNANRVRDLFIFGAGGHAREVAQLVEALSAGSPMYAVRGFVESDAASIGRRIGRHRVVACDADMSDREAVAVLGLGFPAAIRRLAETAGGAARLEWPNLLHPSVIWSSDAVTFGRGNVVCAGAILTTDIRIGSVPQNRLFRYPQAHCSCP